MELGHVFVEVLFICCGVDDAYGLDEMSLPIVVLPLSMVLVFEYELYTLVGPSVPFPGAIVGIVFPRLVVVDIVLPRLSVVDILIPRLSVVDIVLPGLFIVDIVLPELGVLPRLFEDILLLSLVCRFNSSVVILA